MGDQLGDLDRIVEHFHFDEPSIRLSAHAARDEILASYPRKHFKKDFIQAYFRGFAHKPGTTYGTVNAGVCERNIPGYVSPNACDLIAGSPFPDSE